MREYAGKPGCSERLLGGNCLRRKQKGRPKAAFLAKMRDDQAALV
jgi:hypothetical protein